MRRLALSLVGLALLSAGARAEIELEPLQGLRAEVAALLVQGVAGGGLPVAAELFPHPSAGEMGAVELPFLIELPPASGAAGEEDRPLEVYVYAVDGAGEVVAHHAVTLMRWPAEGEGVKLGGQLEAPRGELSVRFLVFDPNARRYGMVVRRVDAAAGAATPRFLEPCDGWSRAGEAAAGVLGLSARPVLVSGEMARLSLAGAPPPASWQVELARTAEGRQTASRAEVTLDETGELRFAVPDLPAGIYSLAVVAGPEGGWTSREVEIWLVEALPPADQGCRRGWRHVLQQARGGAVVVRPQAPTKATEDRSVRLLAEEYGALLERHAPAGDLEAAASELVAMEAAVTEGSFDATRPLFLAELRTSRRLAERDARCLLPLIALHGEAYRLHHGAGRFPLANHSRRLAAAVAELAVDLAGPGEERSLVAVAVTGLAIQLQQRRTFLEAQRLLERALALDEAQEATRLLLAVSYERKGQYAEAREQFEALVAMNSAHHEARVRLAVLLRRMGVNDRAEEYLRALIAERPEEWMMALAYQTLGQLLIREARLSEAVATLEEARRRLPEEQAIQVLLAYALDRSGQRLATRRALEELTFGEAAVTPRYRYSDQPVAAVGLLREILRQSVTVRLPVLARAVGAEGAGGPAG